MPEDPSQITQLLRRAGRGDRAALDQLVPLLYADLRDVARRSLRNERAGHTLNTTALVNEAYMRMQRNHRLDAADRTQFCAIAATTMRRVLVDYARTRKRQKRGGGKVPESIDALQPRDAAALMTEEQADEMLALDRALDRLQAINPRGCEVVQQRFFAGLSLEETAEALGVSTKTVQRSWTAARAWLRKEVEGELDL